MKLYHASKHKFEVIKRNQVEVPDDVYVPDVELQNKIYMTPNIGFAIAMAAGPSGMTNVLNDTISFENEADFTPEQKIYVYEIDSENIVPELIENIDDQQVAIDMDELQPSKIKKYTANDVFVYYELVPWKNLNKNISQ